MSTMVAGYDARFLRTSSARPSLRLTRRGRLVLLALLVGLVFAATSVFGSHSAATSEVGRPVDTRTVLVGEGDTLWGIASQIAEPGETREMIHRIKQLNALADASLMQGQRLAVPVE